MERNAWHCYRKVNQHPEKKSNFGPIESVLHSVCCTDNITWKDAYRRLIHSAASQGTMPSDRRSIRAMLSESGFFLQAGSFAGRSVLNILQECNQTFHQGEQVIVNLSNSPSRASYMPIIPVRTNGMPHYELQYPSNHQDDIACEVWIRWKDHQDHSIAPRRKYGRKAKKKEMSAHDHETLVAVNENPTNNLIGDCAIRALASVLGITWEEAMWKLVEAGGYICTEINRTDNIEKCLASEGFEKHGSIIRNGRMLNGKQFCELIHDMFQPGTKIYAYPGHFHAVAILVFDGNYKILDTWDSTDRPIVGYWVKYPERPRERAPIVSSAPAAPSRLTELTAGVKLRHKLYGVGEVAAIEDATAVIRFHGGTEKKFSVEWVIANCKPVGEREAGS